MTTLGCHSCSSFNKVNGRATIVARFNQLFYLLALCVVLADWQLVAAQPVVNTRSIDGTGNNLTNSQWGAAGTEMPRVAETPYHSGAFYPGDGSGATFYGGPGSSTSPPNPRDISNVLYESHDKQYPNRRRLSNMLWQWGQFLDHDITLVDTSSSPDDFAPIMMSPGDPMAPMIPFQRSAGAAGTGTSASNPRQQENSISSYIDASNVYGSDSARQSALRDLGNGGRLKTSIGDMLPFNTVGLPNAGGPDPTFFLAGDVRSNEQSGLTSMHTLFVREHNRLAGLLADKNPAWDDEELYQTSRKIVGAEMQAITYREFLPALLGRRNSRAISPRNYDYDETLNPAVTNEFGASIYRFGHSMLPDEMKMAPMPGTEGDTLSMKDAFFNPSFIASDGTGETRHMDQILLGLTTTVAEEIDTKVTDGIRNFLFGDPGSGGMDLAALNIQRGRDHGMPSYNEMRLAYGLAPAESFSDITRDRKVRRKLKRLYGTVHDVDSWVGGLAEDHIRGGSVGELMYTAMMDQFTVLRDGDRFFYTGDEELMDNSAIEEIIDLKRISLSEIISQNTSIPHVPRNVFRVGRGGIHSVLDGVNDVIDHLDGFFGNIPWGSSQGGSGQPFIFNVPEPSTCVLAMFGAACLLRRRAI